MGPLQGLPWKGLETEAPGQSKTALPLLPVKACGLSSRLWLRMEMTATKNQTPQVSIKVLLVVSWRLHQHIFLHLSGTTHDTTPAAVPMRP